MKLQDSYCIFVDGSDFFIKSDTKHFVLKYVKKDSHKLSFNKRPRGAL